MSMVEMAAQTGISRDTLHRLERGDASISIATLLTVLSVLDLATDLDQVGADDQTGRSLQDTAMTRRRRGPRRAVAAAPEMRGQDLIDFAQRDWSAVAELKAEHWLERKRRLGTAESFRIADDLRRHVASVRPDWPDEAERSADIASHVALGESLRRVRNIRPG
jgi:transcriptional regulator with XRE-family HTH domain